MKAKLILLVLLTHIVHLSFAATYVYVGNSKSNNISVFSLNPDNGQLSFITHEQIPHIIESGFSTPLAITPDKKHLYIASRGKPPMISTFHINKENGQLNHIANTTINVSLAYLTVDKSGKHLLGASYPHHTVISHPLEQNAKNVGKVLNQQQALAGFQNAHAIVVDPFNHFAFVPSLGNNQIAQFTFNDTTGELSPNNPAFIQLAEHVGPRHLVFHPNNQFAYLIGEHDAAIHVFNYDASTGLLTKKQTIDTLNEQYSGPRSAADIHVSANGKFIYSSERKTSTISVFNVNQGSGELSFIERIKTEEQPRGFTLTPSGKYLLAAGQLSNYVASYHINQQSGKLQKIARYPAGEKPNWIEVVHFP